jgi:hypothetical protein
MAAEARVPTEGETSERIDEPTPNGGAYSVAYFTDKAGLPCAKADAEDILIVEYDADDDAIHRTYMGRKKAN